MIIIGICFRCQVIIIYSISTKLYLAVTDAPHKGIESNLKTTIVQAKRACVQKHIF